MHNAVAGQWVGRHAVLLSLLGSLLLAAMLGLTLGNVFRDEKAHLATHLAVAVPAWLLLLSGLRFWPPSRTDRYSRIARHGLLIAIAVLAAGSPLKLSGPSVLRRWFEFRYWQVFILSA